MITIACSRVTEVMSRHLVLPFVTHLSKHKGLGRGRNFIQHPFSNSRTLDKIPKYQHKTNIKNIKMVNDQCNRKPFNRPRSYCKETTPKTAFRLLLAKSR